MCNTVLSLLFFKSQSWRPRRGKAVSAPVPRCTFLHILAKVHICSQLHSFYFPDVFYTPGPKPTHSFPVHPDSVCPSLLHCPSSPPGAGLLPYLPACLGGLCRKPPPSDPHDSPECVARQRGGDSRVIPSHLHCGLPGVTVSRFLTV